MELESWELLYHSCHAPDISACTPFSTKDDFWRTILPGLDVVREVVADPARISEIGYFNGNGFHDGGYIVQFSRRRGLVERYARDILRDDLAM